MEHEGHRALLIVGVEVLPADQRGRSASRGRALPGAPTLESCLARS